MKEELGQLQKVAFENKSRKKLFSIRLRETDLEVIRFKADLLGLPYQTYINMIIHREALAEL